MTAPDLKVLMKPFAIAIFAKARALRELSELSDFQRSRLQESISDDIKKASNFHPHRMSVEARKQASRLKVKDLTRQTWHDQHKFDRGRKIFIVEHMTTVSTLREKCIAAKSEGIVHSILVKEIQIVWILRSEDEKLTALKFRSKRSNPSAAYEQALIEIWNDSP